MARRRPNDNLARRRGGFTLLELLLALSITALVAAALFEALHVASVARVNVERAVAPSRTAQLAFDMLRADFQSIPPIAQPSQEGGSSTSISMSNSSVTFLPGVIASTFQGQQSTDDSSQSDITFFTLSDGQLKPTGGGGMGVGGGGGQVGGGSGGYGNTGNWFPSSEIKQVEITVEVPNGSSDKCLVRRIWHNVQPLTQSISQTTDPDEEEIIVRGVDSFSVQYYDGTTWLDTWDSTQEDNQLPAAVSVTLTIQPLATDDRNTKSRQYVQVIQIPCSNVINDTTVTGDAVGNGSGSSGGL